MTKKPMLSPTEPVRLVQVGAGSMGRAWLQVVRGSAVAQLVGLADLDVDAARRAAQDTGFPDVVIGASLEDVVDLVEADAVLNVTVPAAHAAVSTVALLRGLPVLCEKPLADTVSAGLSMIAAAEASDQLLMVSQSRRYWRNLDAFRHQIAQLGRIGLVECSFFKAPHFGGYRDEMAYPLLIDMAIHQFDLARDLIGNEPEAVYCESFNPAWSWYAGDAAAEAVFEFAGGIRFAFTGSWCSPGLETSWNGSWRVSGERGTATWDGDHEPQACNADEQPISGPVGQGPEQIAGSLAEFVGALRTGDTPSGEAHSNVLSLCMVEAAIRSATEGRRVKIAALLEDAYREAVGVRQRPEVAAALAQWPSIHAVVGNSARATAGAMLKGERR
jgi:predicted dehydrogenase